jgi:glycosyltransferase involved in cell wall biosynthesis
VSLGLPVRNGERYLAAALDSLLAQTFGDFELIVSDNASTDATPEICLRYAARDPRIRFSRLEFDIGGFRNHNRVVGLARGAFFSWAAHDDLRAPEHLARCMARLEAEPGAVLAYSPERRIGAQGEPLPEPPALTAGSEADPVRRWTALLYGDWIYEPSYGVMRTAVLRQTGLLRQHVDSDRALLAELTLHGRFLRLPEPLLQRRMHDNSSLRQYATTAAYTAWFAPERPGAPSYDSFAMLRSLLGGIRRAPVSWKARRRCLAEAVRWSIACRSDFARDLRRALRLTSSRPEHRPSSEAHRDAA